MPPRLPQQGPGNEEEVENDENILENEEDDLQDNGETQLVRFGYGSEGYLGASVFVLNKKIGPLSGAAGLHGLDEFKTRFVSDDSTEASIKNTMLKYWRAENERTKATASEPIMGNFKIPCNHDEIQILTMAFTNYKHFLEEWIERDTNNSDANTANKLQLRRVNSYLEVLKRGANSEGCMLELQGDDGYEDKDYYYSILPKLFYILHNHSQRGDTIQIEGLLDEFKQLDHSADDYIEELMNQGEYRGDDDDGISGAARSVKKLYNLLKIMFPNIFNEGNDKGYNEAENSNQGEYESNINTKVSSSGNEEIDFKALFGNNLKFLGDEEENALEEFNNAYKKYREGDIEGTKEIITRIIKLFTNSLKLRNDEEEVGILNTFIDLLHDITIKNKNDDEINSSLETLELNNNAKIKVIIKKLKETNPECKITREACSKFIDKEKDEIYAKLLRIINDILLQLLKKINVNTETGITDYTYDINKANFEEQIGIEQLLALADTLSSNLDKWKNTFERSPEPRRKWWEDPSRKPQPEPEPQPQPRLQPQTQPRKSSGWNLIPEQAAYNRGERHNPLEKDGWAAHEEPKSGDTFRQRRAQKAKNLFSQPKGRPEWQSGGAPDVAIGPQDIPYLLSKQRSWEKVNSAYNDLEPEYKNMLPKPDESPLYDILEPFHRYIDEYSDPELLEEADEYARLISPEEINNVFLENSETIDRLIPLYKKALPNVNSTWMPNIIRAHLIRILV